MRCLIMTRCLEDTVLDCPSQWWWKKTTGGRNQGRNEAEDG